MIKGAPFRSLTMPPMYGKRRPASSGDKSGRRFFVEKMTWKSREARLCGIDLRPVPGLCVIMRRFPTADAVGYYLSPFGLGGESNVHRWWSTTNKTLNGLLSFALRAWRWNPSKSIVEHH